MQTTGVGTNRGVRKGFLLTLPALLGLLLLGCHGAGFFPFVGSGASLTSGALTAEIISPANGTMVVANMPLVVQAAATAAGGVESIELWVSGHKIGELTGMDGHAQRTVLASFQWVPAAPGWYTLEVRAYAGRGAIGSSALVTVNAVSAWPVPAVVSTVTPTPVPTLTPTATPWPVPWPIPQPAPPEREERAPRPPEREPEQRQPPRSGPDDGHDAPPRPPAGPGTEPQPTPPPVGPGEGAGPAGKAREPAAQLR